jgi:hypothetical protein
MQIAVLRFFALVFLLPGLAGLVANASLSTHYFDTLPRTPVPAESRTVPRTLNGEVIYLTAAEDEQLDSLRYYGLRAFGVGMVLGLFYLGLMATHLERWHSTEDQPAGADD